MPNHGTSHATSWKSAFLALLAPKPSPRAHTDAATDVAAQSDDDREPFHLDDLSLATRLRRERGLVQYRTPPHAHLVFPTLTGQ